MPRLATTGVDDLRTKFPELALEAYGWDPSTILPGSNEKRDWKCNQGHIYSAMVVRRSMGTGCPVCAGRQVLAGFNDLQTRYPEIAAEAYGWDPTTVMPGNSHKRDWKCTEGHIFSASANNRTNKNNKCGCPVCAGQQVLTGFNDLKTRFPDIAAEAYGWDPSQVMPGTAKKRNWKCNMGHIYETSVVSRTHSKSGCPVCAGKQVLAGFNDLQTRYPEIAAEAHGWDPTTIMPGSIQKRDWKCTEGHIFSAKVNHRTSMRSGCPVCAGLQVLKGFNDLKTRFPDIAAEAYGWDPTTVTPGTDKKREWKCNQGHIYSSIVGSRTINGTGCPFCAGQQLLTGFNDLKTRFPDIAAEAYGWDPSQVMPGTAKKRNWKCNMGHIYETSSATRTVKGSGCPICAEYGFNPEKDAWFYLMQRPGEQQLGITNELDVRRKAHERNGWVLLEHTEPAPGQKVLDTEKVFKQWLKKEIGLVKGTTENWSTTSMEVQSLAELKARSGIKTDLF